MMIHEFSTISRVRHTAPATDAVAAPKLNSIDFQLEWTAFVCVFFLLPILFLSPSLFGSYRMNSRSWSMLWSVCGRQRARHTSNLINAIASGAVDFFLCMSSCNFFFVVGWLACFAPNIFGFVCVCVWCQLSFICLPLIVADMYRGTHSDSHQRRCVVDG